MTKDDLELRVDEIIADTLRRRESGEPISDEQILSAHPNLADRLSKKLKQLALLANAQTLADVESIDETISIRTDFSKDFVSAKELESIYPGQKLGHYVLEEQIGVGGFGSVWRARDLKLDCEVAVKVPRRELSPEDTERFILEARVSAQLRKHPNIVTVHEADWEADRAIIVSDYVDGESLDARLNRSRVPFIEAVELIVTICDALQHAHAQGVVHRDLKPENILLDRSGVPHITDFGLALRVSQLPATGPGRITGTAAYMSPEQARGESDSADCRSDIFSLGIVFFELLTGEKAYRGSIPHILRQIMSEDPPRPRSFDPRIPTDLETICLKCLEKDPSRRYQSATELREDLQRYRRHEPIRARPASAIDRLLRWSKRNPSIPLLSLSLMIVTIISTWVAFSFLDSEVNALQSAYADRASENLELLADYAADDAELNLALRFDQVRAMAIGFANDEVAMQRLDEWNRTLDEERRNKALEQLVDSQGKDTPTELEEIQQVLRGLDQVAGLDIRDRTYSLFLCDARGNQIARYPSNESLGNEFAYRSYFTGGSTDAAAGEQAEIKWEPGATEPKLSDSFLTVDEAARVIAVSAPVWDVDEFQGVIGVFVELGNLISDPEKLIRKPGDNTGNARLADDERAMWILDARRGLKDARLIHDSRRGQAIKTMQTFDLRESQLTATFQDQRTKLEPIKLPGIPEPGLIVLMKERAEFAEAPGNRLHTNLVTIGLSVVGFAALVLSVIWVIILRRVVKT